MRLETKYDLGDYLEFQTTETGKPRIGRVEGIHFGPKGIGYFMDTWDHRILSETEVKSKLVRA